MKKEAPNIETNFVNKLRRDLLDCPRIVLGADSIFELLEMSDLSI